MVRAEPWQIAEIPGPKKAHVITNPAVVVPLLKKAKRPIFIVGHETVKVESSKEKGIDLAIQLTKSMKIPVVATAHTVGEFNKRGFHPAAWLSAMDIGNRLRDPEWKGVDGQGQHDLAVFMGIPYYMEWVILSGLKHFAYKYLTTMTLDRFYQPQATWSFPNMKIEEWVKSFEGAISRLGEK
jgi:acetyl-CoA decarbonylase/synthase complex subunit epsilon